MTIFLNFILTSSKSPVLAAWLSFFIPGGGQFYTKNYLKGILIGGFQGYLIYDFKRIYDLRKDGRIDREEYEKKILSNGVIYLMSLIYSVSDAYVSAHFYNFSKDTILNLSLKKEEKMDRTEKILKDLTEASGVSGFEEEVREIIKNEFKKFADDILYDKLGSIIAIKKGEKERPRIGFFAHMDEIGLMVKGFSKGYVKFAPIGGWWSATLIGQRVKVKNEKGEFYGVIGATPPHVLKKEEAQKLPEIDDLFIDFGVEEKKFDPQKKLGIKIGDPIVPVSEFKTLGNKNIYMAKAFDDRVGCALLIRILEEIKNKKIPGTAYFVATVQEEVGLRGATTSPWLFEPDIGIALDVSLTEDTPGAKTETEAKLGNGAAIVTLDYTMITHRKLRDFLIKICEKYKIKYHLVTVKGGYDTGKVHLFKEGVPSAIIGIPSRYVHGFNSMIHRKDFDSALNLCVNLLKEFDEKKLKEITSY
jgi:endoglucanase